jgi:uncharacterized protein YggE
LSDRANGVTVTGTGRVAVRPDLVSAQLGAEVTGPSVQSALDRCSAALASVVAALRERGVAAEDLGTAGASVYAAHDQSGSQRGWTASQQVTARLRDIGAAGELISAALAAGGDSARLHGVSLDADDDSAARAQARELAFADAQATAALYARLAGRELGLVRSVSEVAGDSGGGPVYKSRSAMTVEPGSLDVTAGVTVAWDFVG